MQKAGRGNPLPAFAKQASHGQRRAQELAPGGKVAPP